MSNYVFAVCMGQSLATGPPARLVFEFDDAVRLAQRLARESGENYSVIPLKTPDWQGLCGNCGKPWVPDCREANASATHEGVHHERTA